MHESVEGASGCMFIDIPEVIVSWDLAPCVRASACACACASSFFLSVYVCTYVCLINIPEVMVWLCLITPQTP